MSNRQPIHSVMISSTTLDLEAHREKAMSACRRQKFLAVGMEDLSTGNSPGLERSLEMVDECDIYLLIVGVRYGEVPKGSSISITEAEYERAVIRGMPLMIYIADPEHPFAWRVVETGPGADKLQRFREKLKAHHVFEEFTSPEDLWGRIINRLAEHRIATLAPSFHNVAAIPTPPAVYVAHRYSLATSTEVVGRRTELDLLTRWIRKSDAVLSATPMTVITAMGGMGKSALTWKWLSDLPAGDRHRFAGLMWWSFYESDATYDNFIARALAYVTKVPVEQALAIPLAPREDWLFDVLNEQPFLICLDGLERLLVAYARLDASHLDEEMLEVEQSAALRRTADARVGRFLRRLAAGTASRILVTTRLFPSDLEASPSDLEPLQSMQIRLEGLAEDEGIELWKSLGIRGDELTLRTALRTVQSYPLLMKILAGQIRESDAAGDFAAWHARNPSFDPFSVDLVEVRNDVLRQAVAALSMKTRLVLVTLAAFRMPVSDDILRPLLVGPGRAFTRDSELYAALSELEGRGLSGWDQPANRYDLHPVIRRVVWNGIHPAGQEIVYENLYEHLAASPAVASLSASSLDELTPAIELYYTLIALGRHSEAFRFFRTELIDLLVYRMNNYRFTIQMLEPLFPEGIANDPRLADPKDADLARWTLAYAYNYAGEPNRGVEVWQRLGKGHSSSTAAALNNYATALVSMGHIKLGETVMEQCLSTSHKRSRQHAIFEAHLGSIASLRGETDRADEILAKALRSWHTQRFEPMGQPSEFSPITRRIWNLLRQKRLPEARALAQRAASTSATTNIQQIRVDALEMNGRVLMEEGRYEEAEAALSKALAMSSTAGGESQTSISIALADLCRRRGMLFKARALLAGVWEPVTRGPLRLWHADASNVLAEIELADGRTAAAIDAATTAYRLAWCDGPPYAYATALERAHAVLTACGAPEPLVIVEEHR